MERAQINGDGDVVAYDGEIIEIFYLDGSKRFLASRLRFDRSTADASGAVVIQMWATPAQMVGMLRVEAEHVAAVDSILSKVAGPMAG